MPLSNYVSKFDWLTNLRRRADITVRTYSDMFALQTYLRKWQIIVGVWDDGDPSKNGLYALRYNKTSTIISDNGNWERIDIPMRLSIILRGGNVVWSGTGLIFIVSPVEYLIRGEYFLIPDETSIELATANQIHDRFDTFYVDDQGNIGVITGVASEDPVIPSVDPDTQLFLTSVLVRAGMETPEVNNLIIYDENEEWTGSNSGATVQFNATINPSRGNIHVDVTNIFNNNSLIFEGASPVALSEWDFLAFDIRLKENMTGQHSLWAVFQMNGTPVSSEIEVLVNKSSLTYQTASIAIADFGATSDVANQLVLRWRKRGPNQSHQGFYLDYVRLQGGIQPPVINTDHNSMTGIQGGTADERYHLTKSKHDTVQKIGEAENLPTWNGAAWPGGGSGSGFLYIAYASDETGTGFTLTFDPALKFIAILYSETEIETPVVGDFTGKWVKYIGNDGEDGDPGASAYVYIAYASDDTGTGFTTTFDPALDYIAIKATTTAIATPTASDFTGLWKKYKGEDGEGGGGNVEGGTPDTIYLITQKIDGGAL